MIKTKIINALNKYLGKYFEGLEENFSYSFWGNATLTDLKLRPEALVELLTLQLGKELPIEVKAGHVDLIKFSFPWSNLWTANIKLELDGLYVLAGPLTDRPYDEEQDLKLQNAIKAALLQASEMAARSTLKDVADQAESNPGFFDKFLKYILNNVQVSVKNIHIRYEASESNGDYSFAVGATLKSLTIHSTNDKWEEAEIDSNAKVLHKLGKLIDLSVYWNHYVKEPDLVGKKNRLKSNAWKDLMKSSLETYRIKHENFKPILQPVSAEAKIIMNNLEDYKTPVVYIDFTLPDVQLFFSRKQYIRFTELTDSMLRMQVNKRYRKYRPNVTIQDSPRSWWIYAYDSIIEERIRPFSFNRITKNMNQFYSYRSVYLKHLHDTEDNLLVEELKSLEAEMNVVAINNARSDALAQFVKERDEKPKVTKKKEKSESETTSWYEWFWGTGGSDEEEEEEEEFDIEDDNDWMAGFTEEERKELYAGIGFDENANEVKMPKEYVAYKIQVNLKSCQFTLENYRKTILQVSLSDMAMSFDSRPGGKGSRWSGKTEGFTIEGASVDYELVSLVTSNGGIFSTDSQMFSVEYEIKPLWKDADHSLKLNVRPVEIFYDEHAVSQLLAFFEIPDDMAKQSINRIAVENLKKAIKYSQDTVRYAIQQRSTFHVSIHMRSPYIVIPQKGTLHQGGNVLVVDLGLLTVESELQPKDINRVTSNKNDSALYDKFKINVTEVKAILADSAEDWHLALTEATSKYHIVPSTGIEVAFYKMWLENNYQLPQQKVKAKLQSLTINMTDEQLLILYAFIFHFPLPTVSMVKSSVDGPMIETSFPKMDMRSVQLDPDVTELMKMKKKILGRSVLDKTKDISKPNVDDKTAGDRVDSKMHDEFLFPVSDDNTDNIEKWKSYLNVKTVDDFLSPNNHMKLFIRATAIELVIQLSLDQKKSHKEYLMFRMQHLCMDAASTIYVKDGKVINSGAAFYASIGGMQVADKLHRGGSGAYLELLKTQPDKELISVSYRQVKPECPDFGSAYNHVEHAAALNFHQISFIIDQTSVCYLRKCVQEIQARIEEQEDSYRRERMPYVGNFPMRPKKLEEAKKPANKRTSVLVDFMSKVEEEVNVTKPDIIKLHLIANMDDVSVQLSNMDVKYAELHIMGLQGQMLARSIRKTFNARLKELSMTDLSQDTKYPNILILERKDNPFLDLKFQQFKKIKDSNSNGQPLDFSLQVRVGHLQVAYLNRFIWQLTQFFESIRVPNLKETANAAMTEISKQVTELDPQTKRIGISIFVHIPTIIVPKHSKSPDLFWLQFGNLKVENKFSKLTTSPGGKQQEWNTVTVSLTQMQISRAKLMDEQFVILHHLVEPVNFKANISIALAPFTSNVVYDISAQLDLIKADILHTDVKLLLAVKRYNLTEGAPQSSPDLAEPRSEAADLETVPDSMTVSADVTEEGGTSSTVTQGAELNKSFNAVITMQGIILCLSEEKENPNSTNDERSQLSRIEIGQLEARANSWVDANLKLDANIALHTMSIDDTRPDSSLAVKRIFICTRRHGPEEFQLLPLISIIYKVHADDRQEADIKMEKVTLNLHVPYILALLNVYKSVLPSEKELPLPSVSDSTKALDTIHNVPSTTETTSTTSNLTLYGTINEPEIVLFGDPDRKDSRILVLNGDIEFDVVSEGPSLKVGSKIKNLKMFTSFYGQDTKSWVIHPCDFDFMRTSVSTENLVEMSFVLPQLDFYISPSILILIYDVLKMMKTEPEKTVTEKVVPKKELAQLWDVQKTSADKWVTNLDDKGPETNPLVPQSVPKEVLKFDISKVNTYFRVKNLDHNIDLLYASFSVDGEIHDWSGKMHLKGEMRLTTSYFNEKIGVWEPLIEPVCDAEGVYRPWELVVKVIKGKSYPMTFNYVQNGYNMEDSLNDDVQQLLHNRRSSSSESETDESTEMTVVRSTLPRKRSHIASDSSYHDAVKNQTSLQGESDSEPDRLIYSITSKLGGIFSDDDSSEDADISETDENDENFDPSIDKPVFLTSKGPIQVSRDQGGDYIDAGRRLMDVEPAEPEVVVEEDNLDPQCYYVIVASQDKLLLNVTPTALNILADVAKAFSDPQELDLVIRDLPNFEIINQIGISSSIFLHPDIKVHKNHVKKFNVFRIGEDNDKIKIITTEDNKTLDAVDEGIGESQTVETLGLLAEPIVNGDNSFVMDNRDLSKEDFAKNKFQIQVEGFDLNDALLHSRECRRLLPLTPMQHGTKYHVLLNIDMWHGRKVITFQSPLLVKNNLNIPINIYCKSDDLKEFNHTDFTVSMVTDSGELSKLTTLDVNQEYCVPLYLAYHCDLYVCPDGPSYKIHQKGIGWRELQLTKDRSKYYPCRVDDGKSLQLFNIKVKCKPRSSLKPSAEISKDIPYFSLHVTSPVMLQNSLPYDIQFSLEDTGSFQNVKYGGLVELDMVDLSTSQKLHLQLRDYLGCDWMGVYTLSQDYEDYKTVTMAPYEFGTDENSNKHLGIVIHAKMEMSLMLNIYSPYWIVNKTEIPVMVRGSNSDAVYDCSMTNTPILFRYKKNKRKKAKLKVYESRWSKSFSLDAMGNVGVVICCDKERNRKYKLMVQLEYNYSTLTMMVTIAPYFLVVNKSLHNLRYMEENEEADLWVDLAVDEFQPFWPVTNSEKMNVKYEDSNIESEHFPFNTVHNTVLRMEKGTALTVEVIGGFQTPRQITFKQYDVGDAPVRIENLCDDVFIVIHQKDQHQKTLLAGNQSILYTWDDPAGTRKLMWNVCGGTNKDMEMDITKDCYNLKQLSVQFVQASGTYNYKEKSDRNRPDSSPEDDSDAVDTAAEGTPKHCTKLKTKSYGMTIYWVSLLKENQRVVIFTDNQNVAKATRMAHIKGDGDYESNIEEDFTYKFNEGEYANYLVMLSLDNIYISVINSMYEEVALVTVSSMPALWEIEVKGKWKVLEDVTLVTWLEDKWIHGLSHASLEDRIEVDFNNMQMTKPYMGELRRVAPPGLYLQYRKSEHQYSLHAKVHRLQIDNQLNDAYFQTVLHPSAIPMYLVKKKGPKPFLEFGMIRRTVPEYNVDTIRQLQLIVQECCIDIDWGFIETISDVFHDWLSSGEKQDQGILVETDIQKAQKSLTDMINTATRNVAGRIFYEFFKVSPLKLNVSFSFRGNPHLSREEQITFGSKIKDFIRNSITTTFTEIRDIQLKLAYFEKRGVSLQSDGMINEIKDHYIQQILMNLYVLIFGLDVLGNPYGLFSDLQQGITDLFYEPILDTLNGEDNLSDNIIQGFQSAMGHIVGGTANSVARVTGVLGSTFATLSMDEEFQNKRRRRRQMRPANMPHSLALAGKGFLSGVSYGLSGIVLDPIQGASDEGVEGFFKGIGKGILGLLTQPIGGVLDMISLAFDGVRRTAEMEGGVVVRMRLPRFIDPKKGLEPYSDYKSRGSNILGRLKDGRFINTDIFIDFAPLSQKDKSEIIIITNRRIMYLEKNRVFSGYDIEWEVELKEISDVKNEQNKLVVSLKTNSASMFSSNSIEIESSDKEILNWLYTRIQHVLQHQMFLQ